MSLPIHNARPHPFDVAEQCGSIEGVRVVFINMPVRETAIPNNAPLGPSLLAARLEALGAEPRILDLNAYRPVLDHEQTEQLLWESLNVWGEPDLVCLSGLITTLAWQTRVARLVRKLAPDCHLVSGGGLATQFRESLFDWIPWLDGVAHSEGDDVIVKIARDAKLLKNLGEQRADELGHLAPYYRGQGRYVYEGDRPPDLDRLQLPAWHLLHQDVRGYPVLERYIQAPVWGTGAKNSSATPFTMERSLNTVSSRGCPFACSYCYRGAQGERNYGMRSIEDVVREMELYRDRYQLDFMGWCDDNAMVDRRRFHDMDRMNVMAWGTHGRLDEAADCDRKAKRVEAMADGGCKYIGFGAESASPAILEAMNKGGHTLKNGTDRFEGFDLPMTMMEGVRQTHYHGIHGNCTWIMGYPGETLHDLQHSVAFMQWQKTFIDPDAVNEMMFVATAYPGTEMFKRPDVQRILSDRFGLSFADGQPVADEALRQYVLQLNDATSLLSNDNGDPLNFSAMPDDVFQQAYQYVQAGETEKVLGM